MAAEQPKKVTGGCLCGAINYEITFDGNGAWPPMVSTCQCRMCRKWTGCLVSHDLIVKKAQVTPEWSTFETLTEYESSPGTRRAFCSKCGSGMAWFNEHMPEDLIIFVGTVDEEFLIGKVEETTVKESVHGKEFERSPGFGKAFTDASMAGNLYWQNAIPGVTDHFTGPKFLQHFIDKVPLHE